MPAPELWAASGKNAGVFDLDGDGRDELLISPTSGGPRVYLHVFVWDDGLQEVSLDGLPFEIVAGGSTCAGGGLICEDLDVIPNSSSSPERTNTPLIRISTTRPRLPSSSTERPPIASARRPPTRFAPPTSTTATTRSDVEATRQTLSGRSGS